MSELRPALKALEGREALVGVEVGVYTGENALSVLENLDVEVLFLVDPYLPYKDGSSRSSMFKPKEMTSSLVRSWREQAETRLTDWMHVVQWIRLPSVEAAARFSTRCFDFVYIDGNHEAPSVLADIAAWTPLVKLGGYVGGHDYVKDRRKPSVVEAIGLFSEQNPALPVEIVARDWRFQVCGDERFPVWKDS